MKPRTPLRRISEKRLKANGGKVPFSTLTSPKKAIRKVNPERQAKRKAGYRKHLASFYWKALRQKVWKRTFLDIPDGWGGHFCEACGNLLESIADMQLAHLTYARFGKELDEDVQGQCKQCNQTEAALRGKRIVRTHN